MAESTDEKILTLLLAQKNEEADQLLTQYLTTATLAQLTDLGDTLLIEGYLNAAEKVFNQLQIVTSGEERDFVSIRLAEIAIEENQLNDAIDLLSDISSDSEAYPEALLTLADAYQVMGLLEVSEQKLKTLKELAPDEPVVDFALAELYRMLERYPEAIAHYERLLKEDIAFAGISLQQRIGLSYSDAGDFETAITYLEASKDFAENLDALFYLGYDYLQLGEDTKAIENLSHLKDIAPDYNSDLYTYLAESYEVQGNEEAAYETVKEGLTQDAFNVVLYQMAGDFAAHLGQISEAIKIYQAGLSVQEDHSSLLMSLSDLYVNEEMHDENITLINNALSKEIVDPYLYWNLARSYEAVEAYEKASENYRLAYPYFTENPQFLRAYLLYLREDGQVDEIKEIIPHYLTLIPEDDEIRQIYEDLTF